MLIKFLTSYSKSFRIGYSAGKTLLWIWVKKDLTKLKGDIGIDLAGGPMATKRFFSTKKYICVDIDKKELEKRLLEHPDAQVFNCRIQEFLRDNKQKKADVLVCLQTMGTTGAFEHDETFEVVKLMYNFLKPGGSMIFNFASLKNLDIHEKKFSEFLKDKFELVNFKYYGAMHITKEKKSPGFIRFFLAYLMHVFPPLRTMFGLEKKILYYYCKNKQ